MFEFFKLIPFHPRTTHELAPYSLGLVFYPQVSHVCSILVPDYAQIFQKIQQHHVQQERGSDKQ